MNTTDERWGIDDAENGEPGTLEANISNVSGALRYLLMGTDYNVTPNAYMWNVVYDTDGKKVIPDSKRSALQLHEHESCPRFLWLGRFR